MRTLMGTVTLAVIALAPVAASAADGWVLWEQDVNLGPFREQPHKTVVQAVVTADPLAAIAPGIDVTNGCITAPPK